VVLVWLVLAVVLLAVELRHLALYVLFVAIGSFAAAGVAVLAPSAVGLQVVTAVGVAVAGIVLVRPRFSPMLEHRHAVAGIARGVHGGIVGQEAITLDEVGDSQHPGHVRMSGERWLAVSGGDNLTIPTGTKVVVMSVQGTTLLVWPADGGHPLMAGPASERAIEPAIEPAADPAPDPKEQP